MGNRLNTARFTPMYAAISRKFWKLCEAISEVSFIVVTGPPIDESPKCPVNSSPRTLNMVPAILNE